MVLVRVGQDDPEQVARVLLEAGRGPAALAVLTVGLGAASTEWRDRQLATLAPALGFAGWRPQTPPLTSFRSVRRTTPPWRPR